MTSDSGPSHVARNPDGSVACVFLLRRDDPGFAGHFPGDPVLPGMRHFEFALCALRIATGNECDVASIVHARFRRLVRPDDELRVVVRREPDGADADPCAGRWRAEHFVGGEGAADLVVDVVARAPRPPRRG